MNKWAILRSSTFHLLSILKPRKLGRNIYRNEEACWVQSMVRACCNPWTFGTSPVSHCWLLPDSIVGHILLVYLYVHIARFQIFAWRTCQDHVMPHDASGHKFGPFWSILNPLDTRRLRQVLLCLPETANDHDEVNWSCLGSSCPNQTCLICAMNVNRSRNILQLLIYILCL